MYKSNGDFRKGMYRRSWNAQSSVEFFPFKQLDLFVFVLYTYRGVILEKAATRMGAIEPDTHLYYRMCRPVLPYVSSRVNVSASPY